jgi:anti-sigma regulatory factor (Ser/Thr protein kinase)
VRRGFRLDGHPTEIGPALDLLESWLREAALPDEVVLETRLVAEEVLVNVVEHGATPGRGCRVEAALEVAETTLVLTFRDDGLPFDPLAVPLPDLALPPADRDVGRLGLVLVRRLVSEARYSREGDMNVLRLTRPR